MKPTLLLIHGGMTFKNQQDYMNFLATRKIAIIKKNSWALEYLDKKLGKYFQIIRPRFPMQDNAKYRDWKIHFERHIPFLNKNSILVGGSLGGIFLAKYLAENKLPKKVLSTYLLCPPFDNTCVGEDLVGGFKLPADISGIKENTKHLHLMFSKDDDVVPVSHAEKYRQKLGDEHIIIYESKNGHFNISTFPELVSMVKAELKK